MVGMPENTGIQHCLNFNNTKKKLLPFTSTVNVCAAYISYIIVYVMVCCAQLIACVGYG